MIDSKRVEDLKLAYQIQLAFRPLGVWGPEIQIKNILITPQNQPDLHRRLRAVLEHWASEVENAHD